MKSSRSSSAQWRSSNTSTSGRCSASASRNRRQAANALGACRGRAAAVWRGRRASATPSRPTPRPIAPRARARPRRAASRSTSRARVLSRMPACALTISPSAQKVTPSPYGSERPWRQVIELGLGLDDLRQLVDQAALADPGHADERQELRRPVGSRPLERVAQERRARARGRRAASAPRCATSTPKRERASTASQTATARALPFASTGSRLSERRRAAGSSGRSSRRRGSR